MLPDNFNFTHSIFSLLSESLIESSSITVTSTCTTNATKHREIKIFFKVKAEGLTRIVLGSSDLQHLYNDIFQNVSISFNWNVQAR